MRLILASLMQHSRLPLLAGMSLPMLMAMPAVTSLHKFSGPLGVPAAHVTF